MSTIRTRPTTKEYAEGWDRMFGPDSEREKRRREQNERIRVAVERQDPFAYMERLPKKSMLEHVRAYEDSVREDYQRHRQAVNDLVKVADRQMDKIEQAITDSLETP